MINVHNDLLKWDKFIVWSFCSVIYSIIHLKCAKFTVWGIYSINVMYGKFIAWKNVNINVNIVFKIKNYLITI